MASSRRLLVASLRGATLAEVVGDPDRTLAETRLGPEKLVGFEAPPGIALPK